MQNSQTVVQDQRSLKLNWSAFIHCDLSPFLPRFRLSDLFTDYEYDFLMFAASSLRAWIIDGQYIFWS